MLQGMRNLANSFIFKILFGLLILSFMIWGIGDIFNLSGQGSPVAKIGNTKISQEQLNASFENRLQMLQRQFGGNVTRDMAIQMNLPRTQLDEIIEQTLIKEEAAEFGLVISEEKLMKIIQEIDVFQDISGEFDKNLFSLYLRNTGLTERMFLQRLSEDTARVQLIQFMNQTPALPDQIIADIYSYRNETRMADTIFVSDASQVAAVSEPSEDDLKKYYEENISAYQAPEYRSFIVATLSADNLLSQVSATEAEIQAQFDLRKTDFSIRPSRDVLVLQTEDKASADQILSAIAAGSEFKAAGEAHGGNYIEFRSADKGSIPFSELVEPAFALKNEELSSAIETPLGWFVLKAENVTEARDADFADYKDQMEEEILQNKASELLYETSIAVDDYIGEGYSIQEAAEKFNLTFFDVEAASQTNQAKDGSLGFNSPISADILEEIYNPATEVNIPSILIETKQNSYFVSELKNIIEAAPKPFELVKDDVKQAWIAVESGKIADDIASQIADKIKAGTSIEAAAEEFGQKVSVTGELKRNAAQAGSGTGQILPPSLIAKIFSAETVGSVLSERAPTGSFVVILKDIQQVDLSTENDSLKTLKEELTQQGGSDLVQQYLASLRQTHSVSVNSGVISQMYQLSDDALNAN